MSVLANAKNSGKCGFFRKAKIKTKDKIVKTIPIASNGLMRLLSRSVIGSD